MWNWKCILAAGLLVILACTLSCGPYRDVQDLPCTGTGEKPQKCIVDMHCHVAGIGAGGSGCFISHEFQKNWRFWLRGFGVSERELWEKGDGLVVDRLSELLYRSDFVEKAVVLALDGVVTDGLLDTSRTQVYVPNEFVADAVDRVAKDKKNLLFGASVNPYRKDALNRLVLAKRRGAVLVKWVPSIMNIDPSDPKIKPFYKKLVELNLPLLTHTGKENSLPHTNDELSDPERLRLPLSMGVKVIAAHIASTGSYQGECSTDRLVRVMKDYPDTLYSDISSLTQLDKPGYMKDALTRPEFSGKLFYGSDFPLINMPLLVSPVYQIYRLTPWQIISIISNINNPWDRDVKIKQALGTPADLFARSREFLKSRPVY